MAREKTTSFSCVEPGCNEVGHYRYANREEAKWLCARYDGTWRCVRHTAPAEVLSLAAPVREVVLVSRALDGAPGLYWVREDGTGLKSGFAHGPGWKAYTTDFPEGTRIVLRAEVVAP